MARNRTGFKPGDIVLRREHGNEGGTVVGTAVVLRLKVKSNNPVKTDKFQKVRFVMVGADPTSKRNQSVGDLFFADYQGVSKDSQIKDYLKRKKLEDKASELEQKKKRGKIPANVYDKIVGNFGCNEQKVLELMREVYA
jgi:hypothetical protein